MSTNTIWGISLFILALIGASAFFSATETAFSSFNRVRMKSLASDGNQKASLALRLSSNFSRLLSTILIGNNIVNIAATSLATILFTNFFPDAGVTVSTIVMTVLVLIFGEISPKSLAKDHAESFAMSTAPIIHGLSLALKPLNFLIDGWKRLLHKLFKSPNQQGMTEEEFNTLVEEAETDGVIDSHEGDLIRSAIQFTDTDVSDIVTPRVEVTAVEDTDTIDQVMSVFLQHGYSRLPVYNETIDNIIGMIHEKDLFRSIYSGAKEWLSIIKKVIYVTQGTEVSALLQLLQQYKTHMAVVVDEFGGTIGIVTLEDILEELVGDIYDEHDEVLEYFHKVGPCSYIISCNAELDDMIDFLQLDIDAGDFDSQSVSGWVTEVTGYIPQKDDTFLYNNLKITVTKADFTHVIEILAEILPTASESQ